MIKQQPRESAVPLAAAEIRLRHNDVEERRVAAEAVGVNREPGAPEWTGDHVDGFGNLVTIYAATNPTPMNREPKDLHDGMAGWGIVRMNKKDRTYTFECWPRFADPRDPATGGQYPGWPRTIKQTDNGGPAR